MDANVCPMCKNVFYDLKDFLTHACEYEDTDAEEWEDDNSYIAPDELQRLTELFE